MPTSSAAALGEYSPVLVSDQIYNRLEREGDSIEENVQQLPQIESVTNPTTTNKTNCLKVALIIVGLVVAICAGGIFPAVIASQVINPSTAVSTNDALTTTTSSGSNTSTNCSTNVCLCSTSSTMIASGFFGTERVYFNCSQSLSNLTALITVQKTVSVSYANQFNTFWSGTITQFFIIGELFLVKQSHRVVFLITSKVNINFKVSIIV